jgi:hypothetical protein
MGHGPTGDKYMNVTNAMQTTANNIQADGSSNSTALESNVVQQDNTLLAGDEQSTEQSNLMTLDSKIIDNSKWNG